MKEKKNDKNILVVDDQPNWRELLSVVLTDDTYNVTTATNFREAVRLLKKQSFDMAILDMRLVDASSYNIDGMKVLKEAKEHQPSIKVVMLTGYPDSEDKRKAEEYGADYYLEKAPNGKPFDIDIFINKISVLLSDNENINNKQ